MSTFIAIFATVALFALQVLAGHETVESECLAEMKIDKNTFNESTAPDCYYKCLRVKKGSMKPNGDFVTVDEFMAKNPKAMPDRVGRFDFCVKNNAETDPCVKAKVFEHCMHQNP